MIMVRRKKLLSGVLLLSGMLCTGRVMAQQWLYKQAAVPIEYRVKDLLGRMTIEEKVGSYVVRWVGKCTPKRERMK